MREKDIKLILKDYKLGILKSFEILTGGFVNSVFKLKTSKASPTPS